VTFTTPPAKPSIDRQAVSGITLTGATLEAAINPNNQETKYEFEYGPTTGYGHTMPLPAESLGSCLGSCYGDRTVSTNIGGLAPAETYHYRVVATNATGPAEGPDQTFTTLPLAPTVTLATATASTDTATVTFTASPQGGDTQYDVQYGTSTTYTAQVQGDAGHSRTAVPITVSLPELGSGTTYHYSVKVRNAGGEEATADQTFTTAEASSAPPRESAAAEAPNTTVPLILFPPTTPPLMAMPAIVFPMETGTESLSKPPPRSHGLAVMLNACNKLPKRKRAACVRRARNQWARHRTSHRF
jgi:hypothetical protein